MAITGSHMMIFSKDPEKDNKFFKEVLKFPYVSLGDGWFIFGLPSSEMMVGTASKEKSDDEKKEEETTKKDGDDVVAKADGDGGALPCGSHELYLMCDNIEQFVKDAKELGVDCAKPKDEGWGIASHFQLPGGSKLRIYEPRHEFPTYPKSIDILNGEKQEGDNNGKHALSSEETTENKKSKA